MPMDAMSGGVERVDVMEALEKAANASGRLKGLEATVYFLGKAAVLAIMMVAQAIENRP